MRLSVLLAVLCLTACGTADAPQRPPPKQAEAASTPVLNDENREDRDWYTVISTQVASEPYFWTALEILKRAGIPCAVDMKLGGARGRVRGKEEYKRCVDLLRRDGRVDMVIQPWELRDSPRWNPPVRKVKLPPPHK